MTDGKARFSVPSSVARRRYQTGSLKDEGWRWTARWREDVVQADGTVKRVRKWDVVGLKKDFPTKRLALREMHRIVGPLNSASYRPRTSMTFGQFAEKWMKTVMVHHKPSTQHGERGVIRNHLTPAFGDASLRSITAEVLQEWVSSQGAAANSVRNRVTTLKEMWNTAKAWGYVDHNPFDSLRIPKIVRGTAYFYTLEETLAILNAVPAGWKRLAVRALAETGMRPGELAGLKTGSLEGRVLRVTQSIFKGKVQTTKTDQVRQFVVSQPLADEIREHIADRQGFLFATRSGRPIDMKHFLKRVMNPVLDRLGITAKVKALGLKAGCYPFRHGNITALERHGVPLKIIQQRVGHSAGSDITQQHYLHAVEADDVAAADMLGKLLALDGDTVQ